MTLKSDSPIGTEIGAEFTPDVKLPDAPFIDHDAEPDANVAFTCVDVDAGGTNVCQVYNAPVADKVADVSFNANALTASDDKAGPRSMYTAYDKFASPEGITVPLKTRKRFDPTPRLPQPLVAVPV